MSAEPSVPPAPEWTECTEVTSSEELRTIVGDVLPVAAAKVRGRLHPFDRQWLAASPFCLIATADAEGRCDVSPKGDPAGFVHVLDDSTIALPDRPGNRRVDGFLNVLANPHVGLIFLLPGRGDTLRINGRARLVSEAPFFEAMVFRGHRPRLALVVEIEEVFHHCSKAFLRSHLWDPSTWDAPGVPSRPEIARTLERPGESLAVLEADYGPEYANKLYG
ncbi:MAG: pyridoxamine 5'-phosphate oxidase family protein [bacterium]